ncbi:MAG: PEGA domain-containing protein [candidate division Zixibacteria bacterium]|nr:PEGA domain-containing protein [candidate division Zixibacteria bacterium]
MTSTPSAARVTVDGRYVGVTPIFFNDLAPGKHRVKVGDVADAGWPEAVFRGEGEDLGPLFGGVRRAVREQGSELVIYILKELLARRFVVGRHSRHHLTSR